MRLGNYATIQQAKQVLRALKAMGESAYRVGTAVYVNIKMQGVAK